MSRRPPRTGNHTSAPQWLYLVINPTLSLPAFVIAITINND